MTDAGFTAKARAYGLLLAAATSGEEVRSLWRNTSLPYRMKNLDPHSEYYRTEVLELFRALTSRDYDIQLEMTSTKQSAAEFEIGYPWTSQDLGVAAAELAKPVQALQALRSLGSVKSVIEFGSGWGNLAIPLAKVGLAVTAVDIDLGFLDRLGRIADREGVRVDLVHSDFLTATRKLSHTYDAVIFQSSFHHCSEFNELIGQIRDLVLTPEGSILFLSEPVFENYQFPWGLRYDGEALWAIIRNNWLELGFDRDFFISMLNRHGFVVSSIPGVAAFVGPGWRATSAAVAHDFAQLVLPSQHDAGFHRPQPAEPWRFCKSHASLPGDVGAHQDLTCVLQVRNFLPCPLNLRLRSGSYEQDFIFDPSVSREISIDVNGDDIQIWSDTFIADSLIGNGDTRELGVAIERVAWKPTGSAGPVSR